MIHSNCRICATRLPPPYLDLGSTPLANSYIPPGGSTLEEPKYPLAVALCAKCGLSQLTEVVDPAEMFTHYLYVSSTTKTFRDHCAELADAAWAFLAHKTQPAVLDIASNDGCLLRAFQRKGARILGVDPAKNLAAEANASGTPTINDYWGERSRREVLRRSGKVDIVTATNVVAHVDDVLGFFREVREVLSTEGIFVFEVPYMVDLVEKREFDTIYHEHLSYFCLAPLVRALKQQGLHPCHAELRPIHGGTIRVYSSPSLRSSSGAIEALLSAEKSGGYQDPDTYRRFAQSILVNREQLVSLLRQLKSSGKAVAGYGASAKGNTLLNFFGLSSGDLMYIVDDNPKKHGYLTPGTHIPIVAPSTLDDRPCDYLLLLAWNFAAEIQRRTERFRGAGGRYIVPVPAVVEI